MIQAQLARRDQREPVLESGPHAPELADENTRTAKRDGGIRGRKQRISRGNTHPSTASARARAGTTCGENKDSIGREDTKDPDTIGMRKSTLGRSTLASGAKTTSHGAQAEPLGKRDLKDAGGSRAGRHQTIAEKICNRRADTDVEGGQRQDDLPVRAVKGKESSQPGGTRRGGE